MTLSKSEYMLFLRQPAWLWLKKHDKSKLPEVDLAMQALFDNGHLFESYAEQLFPESTRLGFTDYLTYASLPKRTTEALESGAKTILQGRFEAGQLTCIIDVLDRVEGNVFDLYEIKSSTSVKIDHEYDLAFQVVVLEQAGLTIRNVSVIHVNNKYVREGLIDSKAITKTTDVTEAVRLLIDETKLNIQQALKTIQSDTPPGMSPRFVRLGPIDEWLVIYKSLYTDLAPHSIYHLATLKPQLVGELEDLGVTHIKDIPDHVKLSEKQQRQVQATKTDKRIIDKEKIFDFVDKLKYPLYFLDYETLSSVIPSFDGIHPYQQVPFQYSLHIIENPGAPIQHKEYLHTENTHPGLPLLQRLKEDIGNTGTIFVWYEKFEKSRNKELGEMFPEYADFMQSVNNRVIDLMLPFAQGWFVDKDFYGSASIKKVLPVLVTDLSYKELNIQEGASAQRLWMETILDGKNTEKKAQIMTDLIEYCKLDTLAMVQLYKVLQAEILISNKEA
ncbi:MAG: DUF2779 domain-containing protein [Patescibacteria group bacterium]